MSRNEKRKRKGEREKQDCMSNPSRTDVLGGCCGDVEKSSLNSEGSTAGGRCLILKTIVPAKREKARM